jgi:hypothetical protein
MSHSDDVALSQLSRRQGFLLELKFFLARLSLILFPLLCGLPGAFIVYKWQDCCGIQVLGCLACAVGVVVGVVFCVKKCSRVIQGILLGSILCELAMLNPMSVPFGIASAFIEERIKLKGWGILPDQVEYRDVSTQKVSKEDWGEDED